MSEQRSPYLHAAAAAACLLLLYVVTLAPSTWFWDTSEYIATAYIFGLPHPPGNPLFVALGRVWIVLLSPTGLPIAVRVNLMAAMMSAVATGFLFLVAHRVLVGWLARSAEPSDSEGSQRWRKAFPLVGAWAGAILAGTAFTVWNQSTVNEKVYTPSVLIIALVTWLVIRWLDRKDEPGSERLVLLAGYLMVLGSTIHLMSLLPGPAVLAVVLFEKPKLLMQWRFLARGVIAIVIGLSFNFVLPIRAADQPMINEGEPICDSALGAAEAIYTMGMGDGCQPLSDVLTRDQYGKPSIFADPTSDLLNPTPRGPKLFVHQLLNYAQYFDWQWARGLATTELPGNSRLPFTLVFFGLGVWGLAAAFRAGRGYATYLGVLALTLTLGLVVYLNFKYGYSLDPGLGNVSREVRERDYFFVASFHLWGVLAGIGLAAAWRWAAGGALSPRNLALSSPVIALAFVPVVFNWPWATRRGDYSARDWAYDMLESVEPYGIVFTNGDNDTFPLWYVQEVEGIRQDVTVIVVQYLNTNWYPTQLKYHSEPGRQRPYDVADDTGVYPLPTSAPTHAITSLTEAELDQVGYVVLPEDYTVMIGSQPVRYPAGFQFSRADQIALAIIQDSIDERPIHFASTGGQSTALGLDDYVVRQGLTSKLRFEDLEQDPDVVRVSDSVGGEWMDLDVSLSLVNDVFTYRGLRDRRIWADRATLNIPWHFYFLDLQLADAMSRSADERELSDEEESAVDDSIDGLLAEADRFLTTAQGGTVAIR
jgi:Protein O-mannosyl-transferase TMEM260-like